MKRNKTDYPGVFYREAARRSGKGIERIYYVVFKKDGKVFEEKAGRQFENNMTPAKAATIRGELIEGKRKFRSEKRREAEEQKKAKTWTLTALWEDYASNNQPKGFKIDQYRFDKFLKPQFGDKTPEQIFPLDVKRLETKIKGTCAPATVKNILELLVRIVNYGRKNNLTKGLSFKLEKPKVFNNKTEDLTADQLSNLLASIEAETHPHAGPLMKLALFTGMRRGELFKLRWEDVDLELGFITIKDPKGGPDQKIPINDGARAVLENHPFTQGTPYVFPGRDGGLRTSIHKQVNRIKQKAGLPSDFRPLHGLRHSYASMLASSGKVDMYTLQKLLTHKSPQMTQRYAHLRDETLKKASQVASDIIENAMQPGKDKKIVSLMK